MDGEWKGIIPFQFKQKEGERQQTSSIIKSPSLLQTCTLEVLEFAPLKICFNFKHEECNKKNTVLEMYYVLILNMLYSNWHKY
jgi:hypothetical protein